MSEPVIFELSAAGRRAPTHAQRERPVSGLPEAALRSTPPMLPEVSELQTVRHFTRLSQLNFSIDTHFYPLGSCTMKYNPRACNRLAMLPEFLDRHPLGAVEHGQGFMECMFELQEMLKAVTGMFVAGALLIGLGVIHSAVTGGRALDETLGSQGMVWLLILGALVLGAAVPVWLSLRR
jgi:glycine dehydrogenase subunit 2